MTDSIAFIAGIATDLRTADEYDLEAIHLTAALDGCFCDDYGQPECAKCLDNRSQLSYSQGEALKLRSDCTRHLVFADWLEERDDPLHELIRVSCELINLPEVKQNDLFVCVEFTTNGPSGSEYGNPAKGWQVVVSGEKVKSVKSRREAKRWAEDNYDVASWNLPQSGCYKHVHANLKPNLDNERRKRTEDRIAELQHQLNPFSDSVEVLWDRGLIVGVELDSTPLWYVESVDWLTPFIEHPICTIRLRDWSGIERSLPKNPAEALPHLFKLELPQVTIDSIPNSGPYRWEGTRAIEQAFGLLPNGKPRVRVEFYES